MNRRNPAPDAKGGSRVFVEYRNNDSYYQLRVMSCIGCKNSSDKTSLIPPGLTYADIGI